MADEPTIGEAMRRLDAVSRQMEALAARLAEDRRDFASTYVRHDLYDARHRSLDRRVALIESENELKERDESGRRRQMTFLLLGTALTSVASLLVSMAILLVGGLMSR
jgi:hypothetical protein